MNTTETLVIGAGHAGLAVSRSLSARDLDHVVLDAGRIGERWQSERWDSLHLLTPNWMSRLPNWQYAGTDPEGYMSAAEFAGYLSRYAESFSAPVQEHVRVRSVRHGDDGFSVMTSGGRWSARNVIVATGSADRPTVPAFADDLSPAVHKVTATGYRNPDDLPAGGVLVVGASASGVQIADELRRNGRRVVLAVGRHTRMPRRYRGMDVMWWLARLGVLDKPVERLSDPETVHHEPSLQLIGRPGGTTAQYDVDLLSLQDRGVWLAGRLTAADGDEVVFADDLAESTAAADARLQSLLDRIDQHIRLQGLESEVGPPTRPGRVATAGRSITSARLSALGISTVVWATGFRRSYPWLHVPALDDDGELRQVHGVTPVRGLYAVGLRWQSRRNSSFIDGARHDAAAVVDHLARTRVISRPLAA